VSDHWKKKFLLSLSPISFFFKPLSHVAAISTEAAENFVIRFVFACGAEAEGWIPPCTHERRRREEKERAAHVLTHGHFHDRYR